LQSLQGDSQETNEAFLIILRFALDTEGGPNAELWLQHLKRAISTVKSVKLMLQISKAFVEQIEFRSQEWQMVDSA
jgi:hypothetical protein